MKCSRTAGFCLPDRSSQQGFSQNPCRPVSSFHSQTVLGPSAGTASNPFPKQPEATSISSLPARHSPRGLSLRRQMPARAPTRWRTGGRWRTHSARHRVSASIKPHLNAVNAQAVAETSSIQKKAYPPLQAERYAPLRRTRFLEASSCKDSRMADNALHSTTNWSVKFLSFNAMALTAEITILHVCPRAGRFQRRM